MMLGNGRWPVLLLVLAAAGCGTERPTSLPGGPAAYRAIPVTAAVSDMGEIAPGDRLSIRVLGEPELTSDQYVVDDSGRIEVPLIGDIAAAGDTPGVLRDELARRLGARFIRDPQVAVNIAQHHKEVFTVEGQVREPGRYEASSDMTLLGAIAMAKGTGTAARVDEVVVMRDVNGQHLGARFDIDDIRMGRAPDPQIVSGDKVVVGYSARKGAWHDFLQATPLFNIFYLIH